MERKRNEVHEVVTYMKKLLLM